MVEKPNLFILSLFGLVLLVSGCTVVSSAAYQEQLDGLLGSTETELIRQFGPPMEADAEDRASPGDSLYWESERLVEETSSSSGGGISFGFTTRTTHRCRLRAFIEDGAVTRFEWRATRDAAFRDAEVDEFNSGECGWTFSAAPREPVEWAEVQSWVGRAESDLVDAFGEPPAIRQLDGGTRLLSWSGSYMGRTATPQAPNIETQARRTRTSASSAS